MKKMAIFLLLIAFASGYFAFYLTYSKVYITYASNNNQSSEGIVRGLSAYQAFAEKAVFVTNRVGQATVMGEIINTANGMAMVLTDIPKSAHTFKDNYSRALLSRNTSAILTIIIAAFGFSMLFIKKPLPDTVRE